MLWSWCVKCVKWRGTHDITPSECLWSSGSGSGCCVETVRVSLETWEREEREERTIVRQPPGVSRHHVHNERCPPVQIKNTKFPYQRRASGSGLIPHQIFVTLSCTGHITHYHDILDFKTLLYKLYIPLQVWHTSVLNKLDQVVATSYSRNHAEVCISDIIPWQPDPDLVLCSDDGASAGAPLCRPTEAGGKQDEDQCVRGDTGHDGKHNLISKLICQNCTIWNFGTIILLPHQSIHDKFFGLKIIS